MQVSGEPTAYRALRYSLAQNIGVAERVENDIVSHLFIVRRSDDGKGWEEKPVVSGDPLPVPATWQLRDISNANAVVVARAVALNPGKELQFRRATFYLKRGKKRCPSRTM